MKTRFLGKISAWLGGGPCWERSPACGTDPSAGCELCPAYAARTPCWSFDWRTVSGDGQRKRWLEMLATSCPGCSLYPRHRRALDRARLALAR